MIYLDSAATSLIKPPEVERAVIRAMKTMASPGRGAHRAAMLAAEEVYSCRAEAAEFFEAGGPENVVFTFNATHALNIAIKSMVRPGMRVLISGFEHNSVLRPLVSAGAEIEVCGRELFNREAVLNAFEAGLGRASLAVCTHVSNAFGFILPIYELASLCRERGVPLIIDGSQSAGVLELSLKKTGAEFIAMPGHKGLLGPQGTGILLCASEGRPLMEGGSGSDSMSRFMPPYLPDRLEAGTHNVCGIAGLRAGLSYIKSRGRENIRLHEAKLLKVFAGKLRGGPFRLFTGPEGSQSAVISLLPEKMAPEDMAEELYKRGVCLRSGLHCAPLAHESAGTLNSGTLRFSFSPFITAREAARAGELIMNIV